MRQPTNSVALEAAVERRAGKVRKSGLKSVEAVVEGQESVLAKGRDNGLLFPC